jgi:hypothetical protein
LLREKKKERPGLLFSKHDKKEEKERAWAPL